MTKQEKIVQAFRDYSEAKRLLCKSYIERFDQLPVSDCGEVSADTLLALNKWEEQENRRLLNEWTNKVVHA